MAKVFEAGFGEVLEDEVVAEAAGGVAGAFFLLEDAEGGAEVVHDAGEVGDDLAAVGIVARPCSRARGSTPGCRRRWGGLRLAMNLSRSAEGRPRALPYLFEGEEELGAVGVFPGAGVGGAAAQADDDGEVLDADGALVLAGAAGGAFEGGFQGQL